MGLRMSSTALRQVHPAARRHGVNPIRYVVRAGICRCPHHGTRCSKSWARISMRSALSDETGVALQLWLQIHREWTQSHRFACPGGIIAVSGHRWKGNVCKHSWCRHHALSATKATNHVVPHVGRFTSRSMRILDKAWRGSRRVHSAAMPRRHRNGQIGNDHAERSDIADSRSDIGCGGLQSERHSTSCQCLGDVEHVASALR